MSTTTLNFPLNIDELTADMSKNGFVKLENLFNTQSLQDLKHYIQNNEEYKAYTHANNQDNIANQPNTTKSIKISTIHYRNEGTMLMDWLDKLHEDPQFSEIMSTLTQRELFRTNDHVIEIACNTHPGLNWHVGYYSFSYIPIEDFACTLWIPLDPITEKQRGGMQYIETHKLDGGFVYPFASWHFDKLSEVEIGDAYVEETVSDKQMVNAITGMIDHSVPKEVIKEDTFNVGDAFLFNKNVLHKTSPFLEGELKTRMALVIRFVDSNARFDKERLQGIFSHIEKSAKSSEAETAYYNKADKKNLTPVDPFISRLTGSSAQHLELMRQLPGLGPYMDKRRLRKQA